MVELKPASGADWPDIISMARDFHAEDGHALSPDGEKALKNALEPSPYVRAWLIADGGKTAGYGALCFSYSIEFGGITSYLDDFYVMPEHRGKGIGTYALAAFEQISRDEGCCIFHLEVEAANEKARDFYLKNGFTDTRRALLIKRF